MIGSRDRLLPQVIVAVVSVVLISMVARAAKVATTDVTLSAATAIPPFFRIVAAAVVAAPELPTNDVVAAP